MELSIYSITFGVLFFWCIGIIQRHVKSGGPNVRSIFMDGIIEVVPGRKEAGMGLCVTRSIYHSLSWVNIIPFLYFVQPMHLTINVLSSQWVNPSLLRLLNQPQILCFHCFYCPSAICCTMDVVPYTVKCLYEIQWGL